MLVPPWQRSCAHINRRWQMNGKSIQKTMTLIAAAPSFLIQRMSISWSYLLHQYLMHKQSPPPNFQMRSMLVILMMKLGVPVQYHNPLLVPSQGWLARERKTALVPYHEIQLGFGLVLCTAGKLQKCSKRLKNWKS